MRPLLLGAAVIFLAMAGCSEAPRAKIHGKLTYQGQPVKAMIIFFAEDNSTYLADVSPEDGSYSIGNVPQGRIRAAVQMEKPRPASRPTPTGGISKTDDDLGVAPEVPKDGRAVRKGPQIPEKYGDPSTSGLEFDLTEMDQDFSVDLK